METPRIALVRSEVPWCGDWLQRHEVQLGLANALYPDEKGASSSAGEGGMPQLKALDGGVVAKEAPSAETESQERNLLFLHTIHRRRLYQIHARQLSSFSDGHFYYQLMMWCHDQNIFLHPSLRVKRSRSPYRQHSFFVTEALPRLTPLLAIPEHLTIGFKDANDLRDGNSLYDPEKEKEFNKINTGDSEDADICSFFFAALGMIVADLLTAKNSTLSDPRSQFAQLLSHVQTLTNAPYLDDSVIFDPDEPCLADVLLQMIRNYLNGGPLVNRVSRQELQWAVSVGLSHSTPLTVGTRPSIGIVPMVHLFPHGGKRTNAYIIARNGRVHASEKMNRFFNTTSGLNFAASGIEKWVYVVNDRPLEAGEEVCLQAMAPVCDKDSEAEQMWVLSCGTAPDEYLPSAYVAKKQVDLTNEIIQRGDI